VKEFISHQWHDELSVWENETSGINADDPSSRQNDHLAKYIRPILTGEPESIKQIETSINKPTVCYATYYLKSRWHNHTRSGAGSTARTSEQIITGTAAAAATRPSSRCSKHRLLLRGVQIPRISVRYQSTIPLEDLPTGPHQRFIPLASPNYVRVFA